MDRNRGQTQFHANNTRSSVSIHRDTKIPRSFKSYNHTKGDRSNKRHRHNINFLTIGVLCLTQLAHVPHATAETVGGVSATASPVANSSGSVTNQAIQVLQGPYITNTYGGGVQCQGSTLNITPYIQFADSRKHPWEDFYNEPQYNMTDLSGKTTKQTVTVKNYPWESWYDTRTKDDGSRWFEDGESIEIEIDVDGPDGIPDAVSGGNMAPTWYKPVRTDMRANQSFNAGLSATLSIPLNKKLRDQCEQAAEAQIASVQQVTANKRLDFEIARLKNCGELKKQGIFFHPASPYHAICADVVVTQPGGVVIPHEHQLPQPKWSTSPSSSSKEEVLSSPDTDQTSVQNDSGDDLSSLGTSLLPSQSSSSQQVLQPSKEDQQEVLLTVPKSWPRQLSLP